MYGRDREEERSTERGDGDRRTWDRQRTGTWGGDGNNGDRDQQKRGGQRNGAQWGRGWTGSEVGGGGHRMGTLGWDNGDRRRTGTDRRMDGDQRGSVDGARWTGPDVVQWGQMDGDRGGQTAPHRTEGQRGWTGSMGDRRTPIGSPSIGTGLGAPRGSGGAEGWAQKQFGGGSQCRLEGNFGGPGGGGGEPGPPVLF